MLVASCGRQTRFSRSVSSKVRGHSWRSVRFHGSATLTLLTVFIALLGIPADAGTVTTRDGQTYSGALRFDGPNLIVSTPGSPDRTIPLGSIELATFADAARPPEARPSERPPERNHQRKNSPHPKPGGVLAEYFADAAMTDLRLARREDNLLHAFPATASPDSIVPSIFAARWTSRLTLPKYEQAQTRILLLQFDGGVRFFLDGKLQLDTWADHAHGTRAQFVLDAGRSYDLKLEYLHDNPGGAESHAALLMTTVDRADTRALKSGYFVPVSAAPAPPNVAVNSPAHFDAVLATESVTVDASASSPTGSIRLVRFLDNGHPFATADRPPFSATLDHPSAGPHLLTVQAIDNKSLSATSEPVTVYVAAPLRKSSTTQPAPRWALLTLVPPLSPAPLVDKRGAIDNDALNAAGNLTIAQPPSPARASLVDGVLCLTHAGGGLRADADAFAAVYADTRGDFQLTARLASLDAGDPNAQPCAGLFANGEFRPDAPRASLVIAREDAANYTAVQLNRTAKRFPELAQVPAKLPVWLRLIRTGRLLRTFTSPDGRLWSTVAQSSTLLPEHLKVGFIAATRDPAAPVTATFDHITLAPLRATFESDRPGVLLITGTFLDEKSGALQSATLDADSLHVRLPQRNSPLAIPRSGVARILFKPIPDGALTDDAAGILLSTGDFLESTIDTLAGNQVATSSVLFGKRSFRAHPELAAIVLHAAPAPNAPPPAGVTCLVTTNTGSRILARSITIQKRDVILDEPLLGPTTFKQSVVQEIRALGSL